jgi:hypothetical protein
MNVTLTETEQDRIVYLAGLGYGNELKGLAYQIETARAEKNADALLVVVNALRALPEETTLTERAKSNLEYEYERACQRLVTLREEHSAWMTAQEET